MIDVYTGVKPNIEAERSIIGAILVDPDGIMPEAEEMLSEQDFLISEYRTVFRTCSGYFVDGKPIDVVTLLAQHGDAYKVILVEAIQSMPSVRNWRSYAQIVVNTAKRYRAFKQLTELSESLTANSGIQECQDLAVKICEQLSTTTSGNTVSAKEGFMQFYSSLQRPVDYIRTGFSKIDRHTYIERGDFVVIGARPSIGKTAWTLDMMTRIAKYHRVVYFSLETKNHKLFARMVANLADEHFSRIKSRRDLDYQKILKSKAIFDQLDFYTVEAAGWTVPQIKAKAVQLGAEVIFIDYLGLVKSEGKGRYEKITNISVDLHTLAQQSNITVIALSQLNREGREGPTMEHLRESGQIEQDADVIVLLHELDGKEPTIRRAIVAKNKDGQTGAVTLTFRGEYQRFSEMETRYEHERSLGC